MKKILTIFAISSYSVMLSQITISANIPSLSAGSSTDAEVKITKGTVSNFAKYQMDVPAGIIVSSVDTKSGNFTFENQRAKIVWVSVPGEAEFTIKFKIQASSTAPNPSIFVQKFYYLENNEKKEVEATPVVVALSGGSSAVVSTPTETKPVETVASTPTPTETKPVETVASTPTPTETKPVETVASTPAPTETKPVETVASTPTPTETKPVETVASTPAPTETKPVETVASTPAPTETKPVETVASTPAPTAKTTSSTESDMTFKVQVGAFSTQPSKSKYAGLNNVSIDMINGLYKVTVGKFNTKEDAIKYRDELQSKGFNGFIAKYKNGVRIN